MPLASLWRFLVVTGARRGEDLGRRWCDIDFDADTATITQQRTVALVHATIEALQAHRTIARVNGFAAALDASRTQST